MSRHIVILGFMACGKTTVAKELARQLEYDFIDLDSFITERHGRSPAEIIQQDGEEKFREIETLALRDVLHRRDACVIALGGGSWTIAANRTLIALHDCVTVWLDTLFEVCWERIYSSSTVRPLATDRERAQALYTTRYPLYKQAKFRLATNGKMVDELANEIHTLIS